MTNVATQPQPARSPQLWPLSVETYHTLGELGLVPAKTELLYGQIYQKMPKSPFLVYLLRALLALLQPVAPKGFLLTSEQPITCADSEPEPDIAVVRGTLEDYRHAHPTTAELVIEICLSSHEYDRSKLRAYAAAGVKEVWLVLGPEKQIEVYLQPAGEQFAETAVHGPGGQVASSVVSGFAVELASLFAS
jgi:Uma2 family endonuclease